MQVVKKQDEARKRHKAERAVARENGRGWQAEKSEIMRQAIMEASMNCFIKYGYSNTTIEKIAGEANVSRGALSHHFSSRDDVIKAAILYVTAKRAKEGEDYIRKLQEKNSNQIVSRESISETLEALWEYFHIPSFSALLELLMAARGNPELEVILSPALEELDRRTKEAILEAFPAWLGLDETRQVVTDLIFYTLQGLALGKATKNVEPRVQNLLDLITREVVREYRRAAEASS